MTSFGGVMQDLASFLIIFNYVIPISLYVTLGTYSTDLSLPQRQSLLLFLSLECLPSMNHRDAEVSWKHIFRVG